MNLNHMQILILDLLINLLIVALYLVWKLIAIFILHRKDASKGVLIRMFVMLVCPLAGPFYFALSYIIFKLFMHREVDLSDVVFGKDKVKSRERADEERARNITPVEEALAVSDFASQRQIMMNVLHGDIKETLTAVAGGLDSDDSETAHYAASVLQAELSRFRTETDRLIQAAEAAEDLEKMNLAVAALRYMNHFLEKRLMNDLEQRSYILRAEQMADMVWNGNPELLEGEEIEMLCLRLIDVEEYGLCASWSDRLSQLYPNMLASYTVRIKLYYSMGEGERFLQTMDELRRSHIPVDNETLHWIRMFS